MVLSDCISRIITFSYGLDEIGFRHDNFLSDVQKFGISSSFVVFDLDDKRLRHSLDTFLALYFLVSFKSIISSLAFKARAFGSDTFLRRR